MNGYDADRDTLPIMVVRREGYPTPTAIKGGYQSFRGTGFLIGRNVLVTCWHCVSAELEEEDMYAVAVPWSEAQMQSGVAPPDSTYYVLPLHDIQQDPSGADLATARVGLNPVGLSLGDDDSLPLSSDVWTFGYPLTSDLPHQQSGRSITLNGRSLKGYVTRDFWNEVPNFGRTPSYELDMPSPEGLSGAPLVKYSSLEVVGVVYGATSSGNMGQLERLTTFAVAHMGSTLRTLRGIATQGHTLAEYLRG